MKIKLNCDMGEGFGIYTLANDKGIMPYIDMANLACGFHASDALSMSKSIALAKNYNVQIGAHPSYQDLVGFGRRSMCCTQEEISAIILYQIGALNAICKSHNTKITYVKPHGALYNDMMKDENILKAILLAISKYDKNLNLMILSSPNNDKNKALASTYGINLIFEVFADRNYNDDGTLVSRNYSNAVIHDINIVKQRLVNLQKGYLLSINEKKLKMKVDSLCVHGDNKNALELIVSLKDILNED